MKIQGFLPDLCRIVKPFKIVDDHTIEIDNQREYCIARSALPVPGEPGGFEIRTIHSDTRFGIVKSPCGCVIDKVAQNLRDSNCRERK
jgi:hypothetical protein